MSFTEGTPFSECQEVGRKRAVCVPLSISLYLSISLSIYIYFIIIFCDNVLQLVYIVRRPLVVRIPLPLI